MTEVSSSHQHQWHRWFVVATTVLNQAVAVGIMVYSFALFVVPWLGEFDVSRSQVMLAIFGFQVVVGILSPLFGRLMDQWPMRGMVVSGILIMAFGLLLLSVSNAFWQIIAIHFTLLPLGMILCGTLASQTMVSKWFTAKRGLAIGISSMGTSLGGLVMPVVTEQLIGDYSWQQALWMLAAASLVLLLPLNLYVLRARAPERQGGDEDGATDENRAWTSREILSSKNFWIPVIGLIPMNAAFGGVQFNLGAYVHDLGMEQIFAAQLISIMSLTMIGGKFFFGAVGDHVDHRKLYWLMALTLIVGLVCYQGDPSPWTLRLAAALQGFATGGIMPMMGIMYSARFGTLSFGRVLGLVNLFLMVGSFGSIFSGWVYDLTQSYNFAFWFFAFSVLPGVVVIYFLPQPGRA